MNLQPTLQARFALMAVTSLMSVLVWGGEAPLTDLTGMSGIDRLSTWGL